MEKDLKQQVEMLEKRVRDLENVDNINALKFTREKLIGRSYGADDSAVGDLANISVSLVTGLGTLNVLDFPDGFIELIKPNGERVRVPTYSLSRF